MNLSENNHSDIKKMSKLKADTSHNGLGSTVE